MDLDVKRTFAWFAIRTKPNQEWVAKQGLGGKGYETFLPTYHRRLGPTSRRKELESPLFPGYLFSRFDVVRRLPVLMTHGVLTILGIGRTPVAVPDSEVEALQRLLASGLGPMPLTHLQVGNRVMIVTGSLAGLEGLLLEVKNSLRFVISVELLRRSVSVEVDRDWVRPMRPHSIAATQQAPCNLGE